MEQIELVFRDNMAESDLKRFFDLSIDMLCIVDIDGYLSVVSPSFGKTLGYTDDVLKSRPLIEFVHPDDVEKTLDEAKKLSQGLTTIDFENRYLCKDGSYKYIKWRASSVAGTGLIYAVGRDIAGQREMEAKINIMELTLQSSIAHITEALLDPNYEKDDISRIVHKESLRLTESQHGYVSLIDDSTGDSVAVHLTPMMGKDCKIAEEHNMVRFPKGPNGYNALWGHSLNTGEGFYTNSPHESFKGCAPQGHIEIKKFLSAPVKIADKIIGQIALANAQRDYMDADLDAIKRLAAIYAVAVDRKKMEDQLRLSEERYRTILNTSIDGFEIVDFERRLVFVNGSFCDMIGYSQEELLQMRVNDFEAIESPEETQGRIMTLMEHGGHRFESQHRRKDGRIVDVEISINLLKDSNLFFTFIRDITERKRMEKQLRDLNANLMSLVKKEIAKRQAHEQMLRQQSKMAAIGEMMGIIAHQWKQPLNVISLIMQGLVVTHGLGELDDKKIEDVFASIMGQIRFMVDTMDDFRDFLRPSKAKVRFDVKTAIDELISMFGYIFSKNAINVNLKADQVLKLTTNGYPNEFKQVILNILNNAKEAIISRHNTDANLQGQIDVDITNDDNKGQIVILIRDNGGGIPSDVMDRIFEPYFTTKGAEGTGIGLYMSKTIIETNMDGSLTARGIDGGTEFTITLPASQAVD
ncbi:MAG: PAS domain S-box protein [Nitrospirae bacterium]|nr:PAS domain S-box protein [Nitrospirota bacterium]MBF0590646.1 PAS domain S-box protein [Nitrospirota bacterium]